MNINTPTRPHRPSEEGYILVAVIFMLAILLLTMSIAAPKVAKEIQRDREVETMQRGKQYIRGIRMYYKKFTAYPPTVEALVKTNEIRFLRKKYKDPTTGKDAWKAVHFGQNKAPTAMGFFGKPLGGSTLAGTGPGVAGATPADTAFQNTTTAPTNPTSPTGSTTPTGGAGASGSNSDSAFGGQTFGGAGIIGFSPNSPKQSILVYKTKNHYNEWEFVYDPIMEQQMMAGGNAGIGQPASSLASPTGGGGAQTPPINSPAPAPQ